MSEFTDYKVADMSLAKWGRKEIDLAETEMPGLMSVRDEYGDAQPAQRCQNCWLPAHDNPNRCVD